MYECGVGLGWYLIGGVKCRGAHWVDGEPACDITLSNGEVHRSVTKGDIQLVLTKLSNMGKINYCDVNIDVVRNCHIMNYNLWHTEYKDVICCG